MLNFLPALALTRLPLVYRCGDVPMAHHALWRWVWRYTCRRAAFVVANCEFLRSLIVENGVCPGRTTVIYNRPPARAPKGAPPVVLPDAEDTTFAYVGQLIADKGVGEVVEAAIVHCGRYPRVRFLLVGDYTWQNPFAQGLRERVARLGLSDRIQFTGYVDDIDGVFAGADVHVCPSLNEEGLPNVVLEAKRAGVPSVVFPSGGLPELIEDGVDGWVCREKTVAALLAAFEAYETDPALAARQGEAARRSLTRLGVDSFAERWRDVYERARRGP